MRSLRLALPALLILAAGCEHTSKIDKADKNAPPPAQPPSKTVDNPPTQPPTQPPAVMPPKEEVPPPPADPTAVRPPVAADLPEYMKAIKGEGTLVATFDTTMGTIRCELFGDAAPMTVANFVGLATGQKPWLNPKTGNKEVGKPYFDGLVFHRVIKEFMIQGGDPLGVGRGGPGYKFGDEFGNGKTMQVGTLAMANAGPSTNGSQFFITEVATDFLQDKHTIFGQCKEIDLVKQMARVPQDAQNKPDTPIVMNKVTISKMKSW
ncbi:MAG: peptidylprolyl isomerase [Kofleriaceae bacterium]